MRLDHGLNMGAMTVAGQKKKQQSEKAELRDLLGQSLGSLVKITNGEPFDAKVGGRKVKLQAVTVESLEHYRSLEDLVENGGLIAPVDPTEDKAEDMKTIEQQQELLNSLGAELRAQKATKDQALTSVASVEARLKHQIDVVESDLRDEIDHHKAESERYKEAAKVAGEQLVAARAELVEHEQEILKMITKLTDLETQRDSLRKTLEGRDDELRRLLDKDVSQDKAIKQLAIRLADQLRINEELREETRRGGKDEPEETVEVEDGGKLGETVMEMVERLKGDPYIRIGLSQLERLLK